MFQCLCLVVLLAHFPGARAGYVRNPSSTSGNGRGSASVYVSARQKNQDTSEKPESEAATFFVSEKEEEEDKDDEEEDFFKQDTELPTGIIPTTSPAPTETPSMFPTGVASPSTVRTVSAQPSTTAPGTTTAPITGRPTLPPGSTAAPVVQTGAPSTAPPLATQSPTFVPTQIYTFTPTTTSSFDSELNYTVFPTSDFFFNDTTNTTNMVDSPIAFTDDFVLLDDGASLNSSIPIEPEEEAWTMVTMAPTTGLPTEDPEFPVSGQLSLKLNGITSQFDGDTRMIFLAAADEFIASAAVGHVQDIRVILIYQSVVPQDGVRKLQETQAVDQEGALQVDMGVEGLAFDEMLSAGDWNMWLHNLFSAEGTEFVTMVQDVGEAEGDTFFEPLTEVQALDPSAAILSPSVTPTNTTTIVLPPPMIASSNQDNDGGNDDSEEGTPLVAIIGAAVGGFVLILIGVALVRYVVVLERKKQASSPGISSRRSSSSIDENFGPSAKEDNKKSNRKNSTTSTAIQNKNSAGESIVSSSSYLTSSTNHFNSSNPAIGPQLSSMPSESDVQSHMGGTAHGDMSVMDNMSYAYSLEPGIEPSVAGVPQSVFPSSAASAMSYSVHPGGSSVASLTSGTSSFGFMKFPFANRGANVPGGGINGKPTKDVLAPPGKLGIVIDTTLDGPVVHKVNPGSALEGKLKSGDIIVAIDGVDTRAMTAASITALMVKTANQRRKLTIISQ
jgi:PDZ domain